MSENFSGAVYYDRKSVPVQAICLAFDKMSLLYFKWGAEQRAKPGDWLLKNGDEVYTVDSEVFASTYRELEDRKGFFAKTQGVWAVCADNDGAVNTKEGVTKYKAGDYLASNDPDGNDAWAIDREKFSELYEARP